MGIAFPWTAALRCLLLSFALLAAGAASAQAPPARQVQYLSGLDNRPTVQWEFYCTSGRNSGAWTTIAVPSCWEQQAPALHRPGEGRLVLAGAGSGSKWQ